MAIASITCWVRIMRAEEESLDAESIYIFLVGHSCMFGRSRAAVEADGSEPGRTGVAGGCSQQRTGAQSPGAARRGKEEIGIGVGAAEAAVVAKHPERRQGEPGGS